MDSLSKKVVYHRVIKTEKDVYYRIAFNSLRMKGYKIQSITCDGRRGLLKDLLNTPTQMCHFHMVAIVMRALRKKHQSMAGKELKIIALTLKKYGDLNIEKTTNRLENLFGQLKEKLSQKHKIMFIKDFLNKKSC